jgi:hypothetical protein
MTVEVSRPSSGPGGAIGRVGADAPASGGRQRVQHGLLGEHVGY